LNSDFITNLYRVISKIVKTKTKDSFLVPDMPVSEEGKEVTEEEKHQAIKRIEEVMKMN